MRVVLDQERLAALVVMALVELAPPAVAGLGVALSRTAQEAAEVAAGMGEDGGEEVGREDPDLLCPGLLCSFPARERGLARPIAGC